VAFLLLQSKTNKNTLSRLTPIRPESTPGTNITSPSHNPSTTKKEATSWPQSHQTPHSAAPSPCQKPSLAQTRLTTGAQRLTLATRLFKSCNTAAAHGTKFTVRMAARGATIQTRMRRTIRLSTSISLTVFLNKRLRLMRRDSGSRIAIRLANRTGP
jgi:hypothetical protein